MSSIGHPIDEVILFLVFDWSSRQYNESMANNDQSEARKNITPLIGWWDCGIEDTGQLNLEREMCH